MNPLSFLLLNLSLTVAFGSPANELPDLRKQISGVMQTDEELVYEVSWTWFKLGTIRVITSSSSLQSAGARFSSVAYTNSYDLPFVDFHAVSTSEMDSSLFSVGASLYVNNNGKGLRQKYYFNSTSRVYVTEHAIVSSANAPPQAPPTYDTLRLSYRRYQDGTSILYYARAHVHDRQGVRVPTLVRGKAGYTNFYMPCERTTETIDAFPSPISVLQLEGLAEFEGIFGLTGEFIGWFTDDAAAVPIKAKMKVLLGSITLELKEWRRQGWSPPIAE